MLPLCWRKNGLSRTPHLDQLAQDGVCLTQHYAASCVCAPSRAALLTGRYPHRTGAIDTLEGRGLDRLALRERTFGDIFQAAGYATGLIGKWHLGVLDPLYHPNNRGFAEFVGFRGGWQWNRYTPVVESNAAMRDGDWKLVRPVIAETMTVAPQDLAMDHALKYEPEQFADIRREPMPQYQIPAPPLPHLYNIAQDPEEANNLADAEPDRVRRMTRELETWFEQVDAERRSIPEADWL